MAGQPGKGLKTVTYSIPAIDYYVGDPSYVLDDIWDSWVDNADTLFKYWGHEVISVNTGTEFGISIYDTNEGGDALDEEGKKVKAGIPVYITELLADTAMISFVPLEVIGISLNEAINGKACEYGFVLESIKSMMKLDVRITHRSTSGRKELVSIEFLNYKVILEGLD